MHRVISYIIGGSSGAHQVRVPRFERPRTCDGGWENFRLLIAGPALPVSRIETVNSGCDSSIRHMGTSQLGALFLPRFVKSRRLHLYETMTWSRCFQHLAVQIHLLESQCGTFVWTVDRDVRQHIQCIPGCQPASLAPTPPLSGLHSMICPDL